MQVTQEQRMDQAEPRVCDIREVHPHWRRQGVWLWAFAAGEGFEFATPEGWRLRVREAEYTLALRAALDQLHAAQARV